MSKPILFGIAALLQLTSNFAFSQNYSWRETIYKDSYVSVELLYTLNDPCLNNTRPSKFAYIVTGTSRGYDQYLNWEMDYYDCSNQPYRQTNSVNIGIVQSNGAVLRSLDWTFPGSTLLDYCRKSSITVTSTPSRAPTVRIIPLKSEPPTSVSGNLNIDYGYKTRLTVRGGQLGSNAEWKWYSNGCGDIPVASGESIEINPSENTSYFVRAEGPAGNTPCFAFNVSVDRASRAADRITGQQFICKGQNSFTLSVSGGKLGQNGEWVWYQGNVNGQPIAKGSSITLATPVANTTYLVRAEGAINTTTEKSITVNVVDEDLSNPTGISGLNNVCKGASLQLRVIGGALPASAQWCWYKNNISPGNLIGKGESVSTTVDNNATYYVRGEGACRMTTERSLSITANDLSLSPYRITERAITRRRVRLTVEGGALGHNANWKWYKGGVSGRMIGEGSSVSVRVRKRSDYSVRAEGDCNTTNSVSKTLYPNYDIKHVFINAGVIPNFYSNNKDGGSATIQSSIDKISENPVIGVTFGMYKVNGWYIRGKYGLNNRSADYTIVNDQVTNSNPNSYYSFTGQVSENRWGVTGGWIRKINKNSMFIQLGAGYGQRDLLWETNEYSNQGNTFLGTKWSKIEGASFSGVEVEAGIMLRFLVFNIMVGASGIIPLENDASKVRSYNTYIDGYVGFGFTF